LKELLSLVDVLSKHKVSRIDVITNDDNSPTKLNALFEGLLTGSIKTDDDAIKLLYEKKPAQASLIKLKSRLSKKILNSIFFIDTNQPSFTDYKRAKFELHRHWAAIRLILDRDNKLYSLKLLQQTFNKANKYEITEIAMLCSRDLVKLYSVAYPNIRKAKFYQKMLNEKRILLEKELVMEEYYNKISLQTFTSKSPDQSQIIKSINEIEEEINSIYKSYKSVLTSVIYFYIMSAKYRILKNYEKCEKLCLEALNYFDNKRLRNKTVEAQVNNILILSNLGMRKFQKAISTGNKNLKYLDEGTYGWFRVLGYNFNAYLMLDNYTSSLEITHKALENSKLKNFGYYYELFQLNEAYLDLLVKINRIKLPTKNKFRKFKLGRFLNDVPSFSKDKRGLNVAILIVSLIHLLFKRKYDETLNRLDSLKQYSYRYLRNDHTLRSNCFIKMLCKIPDANYHPIALERHTKKLYNKLSTTTYAYSDNPAEIEVIPYENLWEIVLEVLDKNQKGKRALS